MKPNELITNLKSDVGIYMILCVPNNKAYIGQSSSIKRRWSEHRKYLRHNKHVNDYLQKCWNKYGESSFLFSVLDASQPTEELESKYCEMIDEEFRLNLRGFTPATRHSEETKLKISLSNKGKRPSQKTLEACRKANLGSKHSEEHKRKISIANKGRVFSQERREKISRANTGRVVPPHTKEAVSKANKGNKYASGYKHTDEAKKNMSEKKKGKSPWNKGLKKSSLQTVTNN